MKLSKSEIIDKLKDEKEFLEKEFGVISIGLFGSYAREENQNDSDIDLFVELRRACFDDLAGIQLYLESMFSQKVEIILKNNYLKPNFVNRIKKDLVYV
ncbi:MAG: nucleotidyltransferase domain-containing protein [Bacteroidetes bacterium]|nr:nucleotidyltransferase domain-containing protein [Bacteroidota bacterium]MBU2584618.1 nucleotidyltransferase domain-containing protein [Bacteroidota bacterium]